MAVDDDDAFLKPMRLSLCIDLVLIVGGFGLFVLTYADLLHDPFNTPEMKGSYLALGVIGIGAAVITLLDIRAHRFGTELARKHANVARMVAATTAFLFVVAWIAGILFLIGAVIREWHIGNMEQFPFGIISLLLTMLVLAMIGPVTWWLERPAKHTETLFALIGFSTLFALQVALAVLAVWQRVQDIRLPVWLAALLFIFAMGAAGFLISCIVDAVRRLRTLRADSVGAVEKS